MNKIPYRELHGLIFDIYRPCEVKKLSVLEITNVNSFDALEHPTYNGLYDPRLGPNDRDELCETCGLKSLYCPGHVGHIVLPVPVFNPVFIKTLYQLLQGGCFKCHRLLAPPNAVLLALYQFRALECGLVGTVQEMAEAITDVNMNSDNKSESVVYELEEKLKDIFRRATIGLDVEKCRMTSRVKSVVECRQRIMRDFIHTHMTPIKKKCPHCNNKNSKISLRHNSRFVYCSTIEKNKETKTDHDDPSEEQNNTMAENTDLSPLAAKKQVTLLWGKDKVLLGHLFGILNVSDDNGTCPVDIFFMEVLLVPPSRFRPISVLKGRKYLNPQSTAFKDVLADAVLLKTILRYMKNEELLEVEQDAVNKVTGKTYEEKVNFMWNQLQNHVNCIYDSEMDRLNKEKTSTGVKQVLEKKEGLFRKHMMGKRVNFAARSVISPDPYIMVDEIGIPTVFATKLTYPTPVTDWNVEKLRAAVLNGPNIHPGADKVETEDGAVIKLSPTDYIQRHAIACKLLTPLPAAQGDKKGIPKKVHRHLQNGDVLLLNRQPTLHKPSIMAHRARVLQGEKTLRLHYANCKSYNADFDGDEMNAHFPQSELARAEGYNIASVNHQYLVPKDGTPLSGLIQDHIIAGTLLTMRGQFFSRESYQQLVYGAISFLNKNIRLLPPTILKPEPLWSGKQIVSTVIINIIPEGKPPPTLEGTAKVSIKNWQSVPPREWLAGGTPLLGVNMSESEVVIRSGELLCGVIDKGHIGPTPYGLIHCCYEIYGGEISTALLTSLARLFTHFLQIHSGFSLGIEDILLTNAASSKRRKTMRQAEKVGPSAVSAAFDVKEENVDELVSNYQNAHLNRNDIGLKTLDFEMKKKTDSLNDKINKICMPDGLIKKFPSNNLQLMVQSGAKGATVNSMQISCLLGQIELEGRRVPLMLSGRTLPSFLPYDTSPRAGGFIDGRFLTGIKPQEFFFHCMAGREGLVDTAVKTSRSGYLQRCLIKHLEGIKVDYDLTVRDSDGSVIQYLYGEDGLDIGKAQLLKNGHFDILANNFNAASVNIEGQEEVLEISDELLYQKEKISKWCIKHGGETKAKKGTSAFLIYAKKAKKNINVVPQLKEQWYELDVDTKLKFCKKSKKCPDPITDMFRPHLAIGAVTENMDRIIEDYIEKNHNGILDKDRKGSKITPEKFKSLAYFRALSSLAQPGEAVGLLAAQSIGEPSTQMTLNTFHFAGRGEMNVTLGIPRLREILMVASANIATPTMDLPFLPTPQAETKAERLKVKLTAVYLKQVLKMIQIKESLHTKKGNRYREYEIRMEFLPYKAYKTLLHTTPANILQYVKDVFLLKFVHIVKKKLKAISAASLVSSMQREKILPFKANTEGRSETHATVEIDGDDGGSSDDGETEGDTVASKSESRHNQDLEYEEPEDEENPDDPDEAMENEDDEARVTSSNSEEPIEEESDIIQTSGLSNRIDRFREEKSLIVKDVLSKLSIISAYDYDHKKMRWCQFTLKLNLQKSKIDMKTLLENETNNAILYRVPNIKKAFIVKNPNLSTGEKMLKTEGVNFLEIFGVDYADTIDTTKVYSNDIHAIAKILGIEAASRVLVKEIMNVFAIYGIAVDQRHLSLIADYMTFDGTYKPCNRLGMSSNASPLQQMTFETTMNFLQTATLTGSEDQLKSPSSRLIVGQLVGSGTGCFDVFLKPYSAKKKKH